MSDKNWPKRPDGSNKTVGEMTPEEKRAAFQGAAQRVKAELEHPATQKAIKDFLDGKVQ